MKLIKSPLAVMFVVCGTLAAVGYWATAPSRAKRVAMTLPPSLPPVAQSPGYAAAPLSGYVAVPVDGLTLRFVPVKDASQNPAGLIHPPAINYRASGE